MQKTIIFGLMSSLHNVFTALWIGGMAATALAFMPAIKAKLKENVPESQGSLLQYQDKLRWVAFISVIGLWITGLLMGNRSPDYGGFMSFSTPYNVLISVKHILTLVMVLIAVLRGFILGNNFLQREPSQKKLYFVLLPINTILGIVVIFLSSFAAAL